MDEKIRYNPFRLPFHDEKPVSYEDMLLNFAAAMEAFDEVSRDNDMGQWRNGKQEEGDLIFFTAIGYLHHCKRWHSIDLSEIQKRKQVILETWREAIRIMYADSP